MFEKEESLENQAFVTRACYCILSEYMLSDSVYDYM